MRHADPSNQRGSVDTGETNPLPTKIAQELPPGSNVIGRVELNESLPAGSNVIGRVGLSEALPSGSNVIGRVGLSEALPAGTNTIGNVALSAALPAGTNTIGRVGLSEALPTGTNTIGNVALSGALPTGTNLLGNVGSIIGTKVGQGKFFLASTGRVSLSLAGNLRAIIENPVGSGKVLYVVRLAAFTTGTGYTTLYINPTAGVPTTANRPRTNAIVGGGLPSVGVIRVDTDATVALSGGIDTGLVFGVPSNARTQLDLPPLVLAPGVTLGINTPFAGAADTTMSVYWYEE